MTERTTLRVVGFFCVFVDPDGYPWEVLHNPAWTLDADGAVSRRRSLCR